MAKPLSERYAQPPKIIYRSPDDIVRIVAHLKANGLTLDDIAIISVDVRSRAWQRVRDVSGIEIESLPQGLSVAMVFYDRPIAREIMRTVGDAAYYADPQRTLDTRDGGSVLIFLDDGPQASN